jgi:hypothetical protein
VVSTNTIIMVESIITSMVSMDITTIITTVMS